MSKIFIVYKIVRITGDGSFTSSYVREYMSRVLNSNRLTPLTYSLGKVTTATKGTLGIFTLPALKFIPRLVSYGYLLSNDFTSQKYALLRCETDHPPKLCPWFYDITGKNWVDFKVSGYTDFDFEKRIICSVTPSVKPIERLEVGRL